MDVELAVRSVIAKSLADPKYRQKIVTPRKGKGSYNRKPKYKGGK
jgi:stalled ribosome alternative rescue factor ArfA